MSADERHKAPSQIEDMARSLGLAEISCRIVGGTLRAVTRQRLKLSLAVIALALPACGGGGPASDNSDISGLMKCESEGSTEEIGGVIYKCKVVDKALVLVPEEQNSAQETVPSEGGENDSKDPTGNMGRCDDEGSTTDIGGAIYTCRTINQSLLWMPDNESGDATLGELVLAVPFVDPSKAVKFFVFGSVLPSGTTNPNPEIYFKGYDTPVYAAADGKVLTVELTEVGERDYVIVILSNNPDLVVSYDHVDNVMVKVGQDVSAGDQLGTAASEFRRDDPRWRPDGLSRAEMMVKDYKNEPSMALCHTQFETPEVSAAFAAAAKRLNGAETTCVRDTVQP